MATDIRAGRAFVEILARDRLSGMLPRILNSAAGTLSAYSRVFGAAGAGLIGGATALATPFLLGISRAAEFEENLNKFSVVFAGQESAMRSWGKQFGDQIGRSENQILSFAANTQDLLVPLGFEAGAATEMSKQITALAIDLASFNNMQDADTIRDLHAALTGSGEVMKKYGVVVSEARVKQELLNMALDPRTATEAQKAQARLNLILAGTTAAQGDALRSSGSYTNQLKRLQATWDNLLTSVGTPITSGLGMALQALNPLLTRFSGWVEQNQDVVAWVAVGIAAIGGLGAVFLGVAAALAVAAFGLRTFTGAAARLGAVGSFLTRPFTSGLAAAQRFGAGLATATVAGVRTAAAHLGTIPGRVGRVAIAGAAAGARIGAGIAAGLIRIGPTLRAAANPAVWSGLVAGSARAAMRVAANWRATAASLRASIGSAVSAGISRFAALGAAASRAAFRGAGRGIGAGIGGALGAAGGIAMLGTMLPGVAGGIASAVAGVAMLGPLVVGLVNPATILIGLIGGGVYAWTRWSDSGRNALQSVTRFFGPLLDTAKQTLGGIVEAFKAGNLSLAGQIALAGLRVVFLEGLQQITALFPQALGPLGDWLSKMGAQLAAGRWAELGATAMAGLRAAFDAGVAGLRGLWGNLVSGMVNAMAAGARAVADLWGKAVAGIGNSILSLASSNAAMGKLLAPVLGVDMYAERQRAETMEPQRRANMAAALTTNIETARRGLAGEATAEELAAMNVHAGMTPDEVRGHLQQALQTWEGELAALGGPMPDFLAGARDSVDRSLDEANQRIDAALTAWTDTAEAQAAETAGAARDELAEAMAALSGAAVGGAGDLSETMEAARQQLQEGLAQATAQRSEAEAKAKAGQEAGEKGLSGATSGKSFATFSSVALAQQIGGQNTAAEQLAEAKKASGLIKQQNEIAAETQRIIRQQPVLVYSP